MKLSRKIVLGAFLVGAGVVGGSALAWACQVNAPTVSVLGVHHQPGTVVAVSGVNWPVATVDLEWHGATGAVRNLGVAQVEPNGRSFSRQVVVPADAVPGNYFIVAVRGGNRAPAAVKVPFPGEPFDDGAGVGVPLTPTTSASITGGDGSTPAPPTSPGAVSPPRNGGRAPTPALASGSAGASAAQLGSASAANAATDPTNAQLAFADPAAVTQAGGLEPATATQPSLRSTGDDLWSGIGSGRNFQPSLTKLPTPAAPTSPFVIGLGVLVAGMSLVMAGFTAAEVRRRRALATG